MSAIGKVVGAVYDRTLSGAVDERLKAKTEAMVEQALGHVTHTALGAAARLTKAVIPSRNSDEPLAQALLKIQTFRSRQPILPTTSTPRKLPPLTIPLPPVSLRSPATPARGAEAPSPRMTLTQQREKTKDQFDSIVVKSEIYSTLWMMHPAGKLSADNPRLHDITRRKAGGMDESLWQEYMAVFGKELSFFQKCKAKMMYWICYDLGVVKGIISGLGNNVLREARTRWAAGENSREPIVSLVSGFLEKIDFTRLQTTDKSIDKAAQTACDEFLKPENKYLEGLSWFQVFLVRRLLPNVFKNLLHRTLDKMKEPQFRHSFMTRLAAQAHSHYTKSLKQEPSLPTAPAKLPSLNNFFDALRLNLLQAVGIQTSQEIVKTSIQIGLEYLFSHPEQVEWMYTDLLEKTNNVFQPPSAQPTDADLTAAKNQLGVSIQLLLTTLIQKKLAPPSVSKEAPKTLRTACEAEQNVVIEGLDVLALLLKELEDLSPLDGKFSSQLGVIADLLGTLIIDLKTLDQSLKLTHLNNAQSKAAFDEIFHPVYKGINQLMDTILQLQDDAQTLMNTWEIAQRLDIIKTQASNLGKAGEGHNDALGLIEQAAAEFPKFLPGDAVEISECAGHLRNVKTNQSGAIAAFQKWVEGKHTTYIETRNKGIHPIHETIQSLILSHQPGKPTLPSSTDTKHETRKSVSIQLTVADIGPSIQQLKILAFKKPEFSPDDQLHRLGALSAVLQNPAEDIAALGREIADKVIDLMINDPTGQFYRAAARTLLNQFSQAR